MSADGEKDAKAERSKLVMEVDSKGTTRVVKDGSSNAAQEDAKAFEGASEPRTYNASWTGSPRGDDPQQGGLPLTGEPGDQTSTGSRKGRARRRTFETEVARANVTEQDGRNLFLALLVVISTILFVGKAFDLLNPTLGLVIATLSIAAYAFRAWLGRDRRIRMDKAGDSCYYLGLTFTLASLAGVLVGMDFGVAAAERIISGFGIALGSTIVGIICRLILVQFVDELDDIELRARTDLAETALAMRQEMDAATLRFQSFFVSVQQDVQATVLSVNELQSKAHGELVEQVQERLSEAARTVAEGTDALSKTLAAHAEEVGGFAEAVKGSTASARKLKRAVETISVPYQDVQAKLADLARELADSRQMLSDLTEPAAGVSVEAAAIVDKLSEATQTMNAASERYERATGTASKDVASQAEMLQRLQDGQEHRLVNMEKQLALRGHFGEVIDRFEGAVVRLEASIARDAAERKRLSVASNVLPETAETEPDGEANDAEAPDDVAGDERAQVSAPAATPSVLSRFGGLRSGGQ